MVAVDMKFHIHGYGIHINIYRFMHGQRWI